MKQRDKEHALGAKNSVASPTSTLIQGIKTAKGVREGVRGGEGFGMRNIILDDKFN